MKKNLPIIIAGPTASGKTELALGLASLLGAEIISADSRQVYKELTIGTAKPEGKWENGKYLVNNIPYNLVDFLYVEQTFNAGEFCNRSKKIQGNVPPQGTLPYIFCGGTGMYLDAFFFGMNELPKDENLRKELSLLSKPELHARLKAADPQSAAEIPEGNIQRTMRALEIYLLTKTPASVLRNKDKARDFTGKAFFIYLNPDKEILNKRIELRTKKMFEGMCAEASALLKKGHTKQTPALKSLGYPQAIEFLEGALKREDAIEKIITLTRQYAKRQRTWFNRYEGVMEINDLTHLSPEKIIKNFVN